MKKFFTAHIALFLILSLYLNGQKSFYISNSDLAKIEQKYGTQARNKVEDWDTMIQVAKNVSILNQLQMVNDFFNKIPYKTDMIHWEKKIIGQLLLNLWELMQVIVKTMQLQNIFH